MKNVLLATTALVAFAGAAAAEISFSGSIEGGYNVPYATSTGALYTDIDFKVTATREFNNGVTGEAWVELLSGANLVPGVSTLQTGDYGASLESGAYKFTLSNDIDNASDHFDGDIDSYIFGVELGDAARNVARLDAAFSTVNASVSYDDGFTNGSLAAGVSGTFGSFDFGLGYDEAGGNDLYGVSMGTSFGSAKIKAFYGRAIVTLSESDLAADIGDGTIGGAPDGDMDDDVPFGLADGYGVRADYDITSDIALGAYYQRVGNNLDTYGVDASATFGAATVGAYYDNATVNSNYIRRFGVDLDYAMSSDLTASAGYRQSRNNAGTVNAQTGFYAGVVYNLSEDAKVGASYSQFADAGTPEFKDGGTVWFSFDF